MTILFRGASDSDLDAICELAELGGIGLTTLPKDIDILNKRLTWSSRSLLLYFSIKTPRLTSDQIKWLNIAGEKDHKVTRKFSIDLMPN